MLTQTLILDDVFDPAKGWAFPPHQVPLSRGASSDGNPYYTITVDGIDLLVYEQSRWDEGIQSNVPATRLVVNSLITGVEITNPSALLNANTDTNGLPSIGLDEDGDVTLQVALPFDENFPLEWLRKQLMVCMGLVAQETRDLRNAWSADDESEEPEESNFDWGTARNVASVAGVFVRAFFDE